MADSENKAEQAQQQPAQAQQQTQQQPQQQQQSPTGQDAAVQQAKAAQLQKTVIGNVFHLLEYLHHALASTPPARRGTS